MIYTQDRMSFNEFLNGQVFLLIQWLYAVWQIARDTTFVKSVYYLCQMAFTHKLNFVFRRNTNVQYDSYGVPFTKMGGDMQPDIIHISKKYRLGKSWIDSSSWQEFKGHYFDNQSNRNINGVELIAFNKYWYTVKFNGSYYFCHQDILFEWAMYDIHDNLILLKEVELIGNELVMGTIISKEEMFEMMLSKEYHVNELYAPCIFGKQYSIPWNLRLSAFLATIPLVLKAKGLTKQSALSTLILIVVDILRTPLLHVYELFMFYLTRAVKLWIFGKCKNLYIFFSWFSKRWAACDRRYGYAYYTTKEEERSVFPVTTFVKFKNLDDCKFVNVDKRAKPGIESYGFQINNGIIHSAELSYGEYCLYVEVREGFFVSSVDALTMMNYNHYSKLEFSKILNHRCDMGVILLRGLAKIQEIQILKTGLTKLRKILDQMQLETKVDNLLQTVGNNVYMRQQLLSQGRESYIMDKWRKGLQGTQLTLINITKDEIHPGVNPIPVISELPADYFGAYIVLLMVIAASDVLVVELLQGGWRVRKPSRLVPLIEKLADLEAALGRLFSINWYRNRIDGMKELVIVYLSDDRKDTSRLFAVWQLYKTKEELIKVTKVLRAKMNTFYCRGSAVGRKGSPTHLSILMSPETIHGSSLGVTVQEEVTEQSFGKEYFCFISLQQFTLADSLEDGMHPPKSERRKLMDEMAIVATKAYRSVVFCDPKIGVWLGSDSLRLIPSIFAWTHARFYLPVNRVHHSRQVRNQTQNLPLATRLPHFVDHIVFRALAADQHYARSMIICFGLTSKEPY